MRDPEDDAFDEASYLALNLDVAAAVQRGELPSAREHWELHGQREGRLGAAPAVDDFDELSYLLRYPDVLFAYRQGGCHSGREHWVRHGGAERRDGSRDVHAAPEEFDEGTYLRANPDIDAVIRAGGLRNGYQHWLQSGRDEWRPGSPQARRKPSGDNGGWRSRPFGANYYGFASAISGLGSATRGYVDALSRLSCPTHVIEVPQWGQSAPADASTGEAGPYRFNFIHQNADMMPLWAARYSRQAVHGRYNIGLWVWELHAGYASAHTASLLLDEIWAPTEFVASALRNCVAAPVFVVPYAVDVPVASATTTREDFGLPANDYLFLYAFDLSSGFARKNPLAVLQAFRQAFRPDEPVKLLLKYTRGEHDRRAADLIEVLSAATPNVRTMAGPLPESQMLSLYAVCDCFVSPHRSEGFGLAIATAMAFGKPTVATGYSGNLQFMTESNSYLVDYRLVAVGPGNAPYHADYAWAEPDTAHMAALLRQVYDNREESRRRGEAGRKTITNDYAADAIASLMGRRFADIHGGAGRWLAAAPHSRPSLRMYRWLAEQWRRSGPE
jgi:glycosyltransferase involved in cell wall biosynthesis